MSSHRAPRHLGYHLMVGGLLAGLALTACTDDAPTAPVGPSVDEVTPSPEPSPHPEPIPADPDPAPGAGEALFQDIAEREGLTRNASMSSVLDAGHATCLALDTGMTVREAVQTGIDNGLSGSESGKLIGAAIVALCPRHTNLASNPDASN